MLFRAAQRLAALRVISRGACTTAFPTRAIIPTTAPVAKLPVCVGVPVRFSAATGGVPGSNPSDDPAFRVGEEGSPYYGDPFMDRDEVLKRVVLVIKNFDKCANPDAVTETSHFVKDLGLDSLDVVELVLMLEDEFVLDIPDDDAEQIHTVSDAVEYISHHPNAR
eukprot:TRINITY_DN22861_c0_g1_i1.p3 TRINITY_DN22861_c0_g1~~TRINITY_DN22861_c0_g1_i1.p3  ORF type:complete len:165 (-),score=29.24 TRINITY_DN22861_c0_g1_i1:615-1109(-)